MNKDEKIAEIRERLAKATPGPWWYDATCCNQWGEAHAGSVRAPELDGDFIVKVEPDAERPEADAQLIANAPSDLAWLLSELDAVRQDVKRLQAGIDAIASREVTRDIYDDWRVTKGHGFTKTSHGDSLDSALREFHELQAAALRGEEGAHG